MFNKISCAKHGQQCYLYASCETQYLKFDMSIHVDILMIKVNNNIFYEAKYLMFV